MVARPIALLGLAAALLAGATVHAQTALREWRGATIGDGLGSSMADIGDVNGDGVDDLALGVSGDDTVGLDAGAVQVVSGADGRVLRTYFGSHAGARFGLAVTALGDVDLDQRPDFAVNATGGGAASHTVHVVSGLAGTIVWSRFVTGANEEFGTTLAALGDVNADGVIDLGVRAGPGSLTASPTGAVLVFSGSNGALLLSVPAALSSGPLGVGLCSAGDLDADGHADFWVSAALTPWAYTGSSLVQAHSGADGHLLGSITTPVGFDENPAALLVGGHDLDGDQVPDLIIGARTYLSVGSSGPGHIYAHSGANFALLWSRVGSSPATRLALLFRDVGDIDGDLVPDVAASNTGLTVTGVLLVSGANGADIGTLTTPPGSRLAGLCPSGDVDGDGRDDFACSDYTVSLVGTAYVYSPGRVQVLTLAQKALRADRFEVVHTVGGTQTLALDFGAAYAGRKFRVLGSSTGTQPGIPTPAGILPLALDAYFASTVRGSSNPYLVGASGFLDGAGRATTTLTLPPSSTAFPLGTTLFHAAVVMNAPGTSVAAVTRAIPFHVHLDPCHAAPGALDDCDGNGVRDGCEVNQAPSLDCNHNARLDACDLASGLSQDCNGDQQPDECTEYWQDVNQNDVPDVCEVRTIYVDDDALLDPGPGNPAISDPLADGSVLRPFDSLQRAVAVATPLDTIILEDGLYTGFQNLSVPVFGRLRALRSRNGPDRCVIDAEYQTAVLAGDGAPSPFDTDLEGITFQRTGLPPGSGGSVTNTVASHGNMRIANCRFFDGGNVRNPGLQVWVYAGATMLVEKCIFARNQGQALSTDGYVLEVLPLGGRCSIRNCLVFDNRAPGNQIPILIGANCTIDHCTLIGDPLSTRAVLKVSPGTQPGIVCEVWNSILRASNQAPLFTVGAQCLAFWDFVQGGPAGLAGQAVVGAGISGLDPLFVHAAGGDFHLSAQSPCIDQGMPLYLPYPGETDGDGDPRVLNGRTDVGWDERP